MKHASYFSTSFAVLGRVLRNPTLLPEIWWKLRSRFTLKHHQSRSVSCDEMAKSPIEALTQLLNVEPQIIQSMMETETLKQTLGELEAYQSPANMGGAAFLEVCYTLIRLTQPDVVVETGVSHGYSTAVMLQALVDNEQGKLFSFDLPAFRPGVPANTGLAIPERLRSYPQWELNLGPDRQTIPPLLKKVSQIDFFHYDSDKSYEGMQTTLNLIWPHLKPGGILMMDDVDSNDAFFDFADSVGQTSLIIPKPTRQGVYRWDKVYYVGLLRKPDH